MSSCITLLLLFMLVCSGSTNFIQEQGRNENTVNGVKRNMIPLQKGTERVKLWPNGRIPYTVAKSVSNDLRKNISLALFQWSSRTCLTFDYFEKKKRSDEAYIVFRYVRSNGCYSHIGMVGGKQVISIGPTCKTIGHVAHLIGHALGFVDEETRPDRDNYVEILYSKILPQYYHKFAKNNLPTHGTPYDYSSIMHSSEYVFSEYGGATILPKLKTGVRPGQRIKPSARDLKLARAMYC